ncbi:MAG: DUF4097 domain-containing protein [Oscillospiraceae bacterium]|jgi:DUF4097 and DUF4098 domain-containing protein YvlB|nr:DUF4097 domain-containing protein [Oscillospiraceae bacterium]
MSRIETKIIIAVTERLSSAENSEAKTELIEELSENLYQRYQELAAEGLPEEEALEQAMNYLGDVDELLAWLEQPHEAPGQDAAPSFDWDGFSESISRAVNKAISTATDLGSQGIAAAKEFSGQIRERYPEGFIRFTGGRSQQVDCTSVEPEQVRALEIRLQNGDVNLHFTDDPEAQIVISGDTEEIQTALREDGVLSLWQGSTASSFFLFNRGIRASDVDIRLPRKKWDSIGISTTNGDICLAEGLECDLLTVETTSGDLNCSAPRCGRMVFRLTSGDLTCRDAAGDLCASSKSGDLDVSGRLNQCALSSTNGDVRFQGAARELKCASTSGDVDVQLLALPQKGELQSSSGDCVLSLPAGEGFQVSYHTVSGAFSSSLPLNGCQTSKSGQGSYLDGGSCTFALSSISGDLRIQG